MATQMEENEGQNILSFQTDSVGSVVLLRFLPTQRHSRSGLFDQNSVNFNDWIVSLTHSSIWPLVTTGHASLSVTQH